MIRTLVFVLLAACGSSAKPPATPAPDPAPATATDDDPACPLLVAGTSISIEDADGGAALVFVTTGDAAAVRTRGQALAAMHNERTGAASSLGMMFSDKSKATAADIEGGVRVTFVAVDAANAGTVGDELRMHGGHLAGASSCKM